MFKCKHKETYLSSDKHHIQTETCLYCNKAIGFYYYRIWGDGQVIRCYHKYIFPFRDGIPDFAYSMFLNLQLNDILEGITKTFKTGEHNVSSLEMHP